MSVPARVLLTATPDRRKRLSDGVLVEASLLARVMGVKLLTIDATVALVPADITASSSAVHVTPDGVPGRSRAIAPERSPVAGQGLAEAVRRIDEGAELLSRAQRGGS